MHMEALAVRLYLLCWRVDAIVPQTALTASLPRQQ